jgi:hypothetical protein
VYTLRALDAITQMRPVDQLVLGDVRLRCLPLLSSGAKGALPPASLADDPAQCVRFLTDRTRD